MNPLLTRRLLSALVAVLVLLPPAQFWLAAPEGLPASCGTSCACGDVEGSTDVVAESGCGCCEPAPSPVVPEPEPTRTAGGPTIEIVVLPHGDEPPSARGSTASTRCRPRPHPRCTPPPVRDLYGVRLI